MSSRSKRPSDVTSYRATANGFTHPTKHLGTQALLRAGVYREQPIDALLPQFVHHGVELFFGRDVAHARAEEALIQLIVIDQPSGRRTFSTTSWSTMRNAVVPTRDAILA